MLVRNANMRLQADRGQLPALRDQVSAWLEGVGGHVSHSSSNAGYQDHQSQRMAGASLALRLSVPAPQFFSAMAFLRDLVGGPGSDDLLSESTDVVDVTESFVDHTARAKSLEGTHGALLRLLEKAHGVNEVLQVQRELRNVLQQLESRKAQARSLKTKSEFSKISVTIAQRPLAPLPRPNPGDDDENGSPWASWDPTTTVRRVVRLFARLLVAGLDLGIVFGMAAVPLSVAALGLRWVLHKVGVWGGGSDDGSVLGGGA